MVVERVGAEVLMGLRKDNSYSLSLFCEYSYISVLYICLFTRSLKVNTLISLWFRPILWSFSILGKSGFSHIIRFLSYAIPELLLLSTVKVVWSFLKGHNLISQSFFFSNLPHCYLYFSTNHPLLSHNPISFISIP